MRKQLPVSVIPDLVNKNNNNTNGDMKVGLLNIILHPPCTILLVRFMRLAALLAALLVGMGLTGQIYKVGYIQEDRDIKCWGEMN